MACATFVLLLD